MRRAVGGMRQKVAGMRHQPDRGQPALSEVLEQIRVDPAATMRLSGLTPDPWQATLCRSSNDRILVLTARQVGKSTTVAALALHTILTWPDSLVLLLSPSERQSGELAVKVLNYYDRLGKPIAARKRTELQLNLANGSR